METIKVKTNSPALRFTVVGLNPNVVVVVFGVRAPAPGTFDPINEVLAKLSLAKPTSDVTLPLSGSEFRHAAIKFSLTTFKADVGTAEIQVTRAQDPPDPTTMARPVNLRVQLARLSPTAPTYVEASVVLEEDS